MSKIEMWSGKKVNIDTNIIFYSVLAIGFFFYLRFFINPALYFTAQEPVFFVDTHFLSEFITYPGGPLEYLAMLLSQFYFLPWLGALIITAIFALIFLIFSRVITSLIKKESTRVALVPIAILFFAHHDYEHPLVIDLALLTSLLALYFYSKVTAWPRLLFIVLGGFVFYVVAGSAFLLFCMFAIVFEFLTSRHIAALLSLLIMPVMLPLAAANGLFLVRTADAFLQPAFPASHSATLLLLLYASIPVLLLAATLLAKLNLIKNVKRKFVIFGQIVVLAVFSAIAFFAVNKTERNFWQITYYAQMSDWEKIVAKGENPCPTSPQILSLINRALCHTGRMGDALFSYQQDFGLNGLFVMDDTQLSSPLIRSDLYFDLGHYNEAKHWAHEAVSVRGETLWNLQRLVTVLLIYEDRAAAELYLNKLEKNILAKRWAKHFKQYVDENINLRNDPYFGPLLQNKVEENFLVFVNNPVPDLYKLLRANSLNTAASDYLMASLLLTKKVAQCADLVQRNFKNFQAPRHYQEALIFYASQTHHSDIDLNIYVERETVERFQAFQASFRANRQNPQLAQKALAVSYGDSYWYYLVFHQQARGA